MAEHPSAPSGTVTFLFTDIEGSTALWQEHPASMGPAVERHDEVIRSAVEQRGGYVFTTAGDSFAVAFARADEAVRASVEAQTRLLDEAWPPDTVISARMGLHTGEATERQGDYYGVAVNRAARLMSIGHGGQILLSETTAALVEGAGFQLRDLGLHRLKDLTSPTAVRQIIDPRLPNTFPALRSLDSFRHNLPIRADQLVGREREIKELNELLAQERLVSIIGPGGMGKTRVALQVGANLIEQYSDGVHFVDLTPCEPDVESVAAAVGRSLGFEARTGETWSQTVAAALPVYETLLVVDNCEHVLDGAVAVLRSILDRSPNIQLLTTTRERLGLTGERSYPLPPFEDGAELFAARALAIDPMFDVDSTSAAVERICERLDNMPLAIELAAARVSSLQPEEMLSRLDQRFRLLRSRDRTLDARHRTLLATIEWSYEQLSPEAQQLFCDLGVIVATFDLAAVLGLEPDLDELDVMDLLDELESKSLIRADRDGASTRYRLLETMRAFALARLQADGSLTDVEGRHAQMRAELAERRVVELYEADVPATTAALRAYLLDLDDLQAAYFRCCETDPHRAERILETTQCLMMVGAVDSRNEQMADRMLELYQAGQCRHMSALHAADVLGRSGRMAETETLTTEILGRDDLTDGERALALAVRSWMAVVHRNSLEEGAALADEALALAPAIEDDFTRAGATFYSIIQLFQAGRYERAVAASEDRSISDNLPRSGLLAPWRDYVDGTVLRPTDPARSTELMEQALRLATDIGNQHIVAWMQYQVAINRLIERENERAAGELATCLPGLLDRGDPHIVALALEDLGAALSRIGESESATVAFSAADHERARIDVTMYGAYVERRERLIPRLRHQLGSDRFDSAWAEGQTMTLDEAILYAATGAGS